MEFIHRQHAHCESGVTTNLLQHQGLPITEPLAFGIGAGLSFGHVPFLKVNGVPVTTYRTWPGAIFKRLNKRLGVGIHAEKFRTPEEAMRALDEALARGIPVGLQASIYYLPYMPEAFRFHFNAHNFVVYGKEGDEYLVSDPILEGPSRIKAEDLSRARFAKGTPEPRGFMYYVDKLPEKTDLKEAIRKGIRQTCNLFWTPPFMPWFGNRAIKYLADRIAQYPNKMEPRKAAHYLGNIIRMQEEIGTGGAGFRYLYAAFLQEAAAITGKPELAVFAQELTAIGDRWRDFAYLAARQVKARQTDRVSFDELKRILYEIGDREKSFFHRLGKMSW